MHLPPPHPLLTLNPIERAVFGLRTMYHFQWLSIRVGGTVTITRDALGVTIS